MNVLVIEDEKPATDRLISMIREISPEVRIVGTADSVKSSVRWIQSNPAPDVIFMDIHLADGLSFKIFDLIKVETPVIFTTAYNEYALKAFKVNSIDYLLKPVDKEELAKSLEKFKKLFRKAEERVVYNSDAMQKILLAFTNPYKSRFVVKVGEHLRHIGTEEITFFNSMEKETFLNTNLGKCYGLEYSLDQLEELTDPKLFFRINRKYIIHLKYIKDIIAYSGSRLRIKIDNVNTDDMIVSREKVNEFKNWLEGEKK